MLIIQWKNNRLLQNFKSGIQKSKKGASVIELLVVIFIIVVALTSLFGVVAFSLGVSTSIKITTQANALAQETVEAVRNFRDGTAWDTDGLGTLALGTAYYPEKSVGVPPEWTLAAGEETIDIFTRKVVFSSVVRDANDDIVESGGVNDPDTKKATITISWDAKELEIETYFTNWR
ncbi:hypothetical protein ACFL11_00520 [Patescibacteria group bacterium]